MPADRAMSGIAERLCALGQPIALQKGAELAASDDQDRLVYVADGAAKLVAKSASDQVQVLAFHLAGDVIPVLDRRSGDFRLVALAPIELVNFPVSDFLDLAQEDPQVLRFMLTRSIEALHNSRTKMMRLGHRSARQRVSGFLLSMADRLCGRSAGQCVLNLPMSRRDIGESLGLTIETVSRQFAELRDIGLLDTQGRSIVRLHDLGALAIAAGQLQKNRETQEN